MKAMNSIFCLFFIILPLLCSSYYVEEQFEDNDDDALTNLERMSDSNEESTPNLSSFGGTKRNSSKRGGSDIKTPHWKIPNLPKIDFPKQGKGRDGENDKKSTPKIELDKISKNAVEGYYYDEAQDKGIQFSTQSDGTMTIKTLQGHTIVKHGKVFYATIESTDGMEYDYTGTERVANILLEVSGNSILRQKDGDYYLSSSQARAIKYALASSSDEVSDQEAFENVLQSLDKTDTAYHRKAIAESISDLLDDSHYPLINQAVHYMGETIGLTGRDYPSLLPLYMMAMKLEDIDQEDSMIEIELLRKLRKWFWKRKRKTQIAPQCLNNISQCPPCPNQKCLGLCGRKCKCWRWVCGDCCYHYGCYIHDLKCKHCGFISTKCIFGSFRVRRRCNSKKVPKIWTTRC